MVADFNSDGNPDLAVANFLDNNLSILLGNGDGTFETRVNYPTGTNPNSLAGGDLNGDGKLDLVTANNASNASVLLGNGDGTFQTHVDYGTGSGPDQVAIGDFNGDGRLDLAIANGTSNTISILMDDCARVHHALLQGLTNCVTPWAIGRAFGVMNLDIQTGPQLATYARYNVLFE